MSKGTIPQPFNAKRFLQLLTAKTDWVNDTGTLVYSDGARFSSKSIKDSESVESVHRIVGGIAQKMGWDKQQLVDVLWGNADPPSLADPRPSVEATAALNRLRSLQGKHDQDWSKAKNDLATHKYLDLNL